jgi:hypothetical protein
VEKIRAHIGPDPGFAPDPGSLRLHPPEYADAAAVPPGEYARNPELA